ncbi:MAG: DegT/DnrJ/EryC1/StrS family aminotransferase [Endomicrobiales bacterium]
MKRTCIVNNDYSLSALAQAVLRLVSGQGKGIAPLEQQLAEFLGVKYCHLASSGFAALHVLLQSLREAHPGRDEVVMPAYTAPGLVLPARALGLKVRLCDISLESFTLDTKALGSRINDRTLAVIPAHLFGIPFDAGLVEDCARRGVPVIEDAAQSLGSETRGKKTGSLAPLAFGSFGRGKNFSLYHGGFIAHRSDELAAVIEKHHRQLPPAAPGRAFAHILKHLVFSCAVHPALYPLTSLVTARLRSKKEQEEYDLSAMEQGPRRLGSLLFENWRASYARRIENGRYLGGLLHTLPGISIPRFPDDSSIAFNRFPVLVEDPQQKERLFASLNRAGIEASCMYGKPVHALWDLGYRSGDFPSAEYLAGHLLTLPAHGYAGKGEMDAIFTIFGKVIAGSGAGT